MERPSLKRRSGLVSQADEGEATRLSARFPALASMSDVALDSPALTGLFQTRDELEVWTRVVSAIGASTIPDLLEVSEPGLARLLGSRFLPVAEVLGLLSWLDQAVAETGASAGVTAKVLESPEGVGVPDWVRLGDLFTWLDEAVGIPISSEHLDRAALTHEDGLALKRIRRNVDGSVGDLLKLTIADLAAWSSIGAKRLRDVLQFLGRFDASVAGSSSLDPGQALTGGLPGDEVVWRQLASRVVELEVGVSEEHRQLRSLLPPLREVSRLRLGDPEVEAFVRSRLERTALQSLRSQPSVSTFGDLLELTPAQIAGWPGVDPTWLEVILGFLGHLSANAFDLAESAGLDINEEPEQVREHPAALLLVTRWVATTRGSATWADLLAAAEDPKPAAIEEAWQGLMALAVSPESGATAADVLNGYLGTLDERHLAILTGRVLSQEGRTLDDLGAEFGITRERVRQIERKMIDRLQQNFAGGDEWEPVRWIAEATAARLGAFAPIDLHTEALRILPDDQAALVTWLLGYRVDSEHARRSNFELPSAAQCPRLYPGTKVVDEFTLAENLREGGVRDDLVDLAIGAIDGLNRIDDQLVDWSGSQVDRAKTVLQVRDEPQGVDELFELVGGSSKVSFRNRILEDEEIMRVTKSKFGLRDWGGTRYTTIVELMADRLASGPRTIEELGQELQETYEVSANSIAMYSSAPIFKVTGDTVALRARNDPYIARDRPSAVPGLFMINDHRAHWTITVDTEILRGSGRSLPHEIGTFLGLAPGDTAEVTCNGSSVSLSWPETSHTGPIIGSLRAHVEDVGATADSLVRLEFFLTDMRLHLHLVPPVGAGESPSQTLSRITGIEPDRCDDLVALAEALRVEESDLVTALEKRRDGVLARAASLLSGSG